MRERAMRAQQRIWNPARTLGIETNDGSTNISTCYLHNKYNRKKCMNWFAFRVEPESCAHHREVSIERMYVYLLWMRAYAWSRAYAHVAFATRTQHTSHCTQRTLHIHMSIWFREVATVVLLAICVHSLSLCARIVMVHGAYTELLCARISNIGAMPCINIFHIYIYLCICVVE